MTADVTPLDLGAAAVTLGDAYEQIDLRGVLDAHEANGLLATSRALYAEVERLRAGVDDFDNNPTALAWARSKVEREVAKLRSWQRQAADRGNAEQSAGWSRIANHLERTFVGGDGCIVAAFDERKPALNHAIKATSNEGD